MRHIDFMAIDYDAQSFNGEEEGSNREEKSLSSDDGVVS